MCPALSLSTHSFEAQFHTEPEARWWPASPVIPPLSVPCLRSIPLLIVTYSQTYRAWTLHGTRRQVSNKQACLRGKTSMYFCYYSIRIEPRASHMLSTCPGVQLPSLSLGDRHSRAPGEFRQKPTELGMTRWWPESSPKEKRIITLRFQHFF